MGLGEWLQRLLGAPPPPVPQPTRTVPPPVSGQSAATPTALPEGWTDDMTVALPPGRTVAEVVEVVIQAALSGIGDAETERRLSAEFGLSADDAALARDRAFGGLVRAGTRIPENCPSPVKDPVAWESFQRGTRDPALVSRIYPQMFPGS
ncbi:hypothetical protein VT84_10980 [Gemmata sp. SH-PL17]|nr:hypothetical protein VT84_10980 [Gemmata sp. SH-PL17]